MNATFWFKQNVRSPSLDGRSMLGYIKGGYKAWADDLFVKEFGDQRWANHVRYIMVPGWALALHPAVDLLPLMTMLNGTGGFPLVARWGSTAVYSAVLRSSS